MQAPLHPASYRQPLCVLLVSARRLLHIPRHTLRLTAFVLAAVLGAGTILFFALTRTEVGRDALRAQMEKQFAETFEGRLEIDALKGNLIQHLFASGVRFYDPDGHLVLHIDSVVARPHWGDVLRRRFSVGSLSVIRPTFYFRYRADSTWNVAAVFRRHNAAPTAGPQPWSFDSADLHLTEGTIHTRHQEALPPGVETGWLFNYAATHAQQVEARATIEWRTDIKLIDVLSFTATLPDVPFAIANVQGQLLIEPEGLFVNQLTLDAEGTDLRFDGALTRPDSTEALTLDGELHPSQFDFAALRRLVPRLPLDDVLTASARVQGALDQLVVEEVVLAHGQTRLQAEGTLLTVADSLDFDVALRNATVASRDLQTVLPTLTLPAFDHLGVLALDGTVQGVARGGTGTPLSLRTSADLDVRSAAGRLGGTVSIRQRPGQSLRYALDVVTDSLDVGRILQNDRLSSLLNGRVTAQGSGLSLDSLTTTVRADFYAARFAGRRADTVHVDGSVAGRRLEATAFARQGRQGVFANGVLNWNTPLPSYRLGLNTTSLDLGPLLATDSLRSSLNSQWALEAQGARWEDLRGELTVMVKPSEMQWGRRVRQVPTHQSVVTVRPPDADAPRLEVTGDALALRLDGARSADATRALIALWSQVLGTAWAQQSEKLYARATPIPGFVDALVDDPSLDRILRQEDARRALQAARLDTVAIDLALDVKRADLVGALLPMLPPLATDLRTTVQVAANADRLRLGGTARADSLRLNTLYAEAYQADFEAALALNAPVEETLQAILDAHADTLRLGRQALHAPRLRVGYQNRKADLALTTARNEAVGPASLEATLDVLPDRHRLTLKDFNLTLGGYTWEHPQHEVIDLFADAVVIPGVLLESRPAGDEAIQRLRLRGALSSLPQDTLFVELDAIGLEQLSDFLGSNRTFGGTLNGQVALTGTTQRELTGALTVRALALDDRILGHLDASSRYVPGTPDVALDLTLHPIDPDDSTLPTGYRRTRNDLTLAGTFRLPQTGENSDPGALDLRLQTRRADAFFFEYILKEVDNVEGAFAGTGAIRGTFSYPLFEADLTLTDGRFDVPEFNLKYRVDGPVRVDDKGIRLDRIVFRDPTDGSATITGTLFFNDYRFFSFDLQGQLQAMQIIDVPTFSRQLPFYGTIWATGDATLTGPLDNAFLRAANVVTTEQSELFIPLTTAATAVDPGFIIFADSSGQAIDEVEEERRKNILTRPATERTFTEGISMDLSILAPQGSTVHLVIDPLLGDVINAVGSGRIQLQRREGDFFTFGTFEVDSGDYLFTAGEVFVRRFLINDGTIAWTSDPLNPRLDIQAAYRTRASRAGLPDDLAERLQASIPLIVDLHITGPLNAVLVDLTLTIDRSRQEAITNTPFLETYLNQSDRAAQHATSVLLTNSFLLSTEGTSNNVLAGSAFNSVSQLVSSQLNRYLSEVIPNADFTFGVQSDEGAQDLDVSAAVAIRLLNERLVIRGQGIYRGFGDPAADATQQSLQGEFIVEVRLSPSVSVEVFYRREGDVLSESLITSETGAGLSYQTQFSTWRKLLDRIFGRKRRAEVASDSTGTVVEAKQDGS